MGREEGKGCGLLASGKTRPASPPEWEIKMVPPRPLEWQKTLGRTARECEGGSSCRRASTPPEWKSCLQETKPPGFPPRVKKCLGRTNGVWEGTEPPHYLSNRGKHIQRRR